MYKSRKRNWFSQWNFHAPLVWLIDWCKEIKLGRKLFKCLLIIFVAQVVVPCIADTPRLVYATWRSHEEMVKAQKLEIEREAARREREFLEARRQQEERERRRQEKLAEEERDAYKKKIEEMKECITVGDRVEITWWGETGIGPKPPEGNYNVGRITSIDGFKISGNWGPYVIDWETGPHFVTLSAKEYKEKLRKEEERVARKIAKEEKKNQKRKSWGIYPGTIYTGKDGREYISTIQNGKLVQKLYKK